VKIDVGRALPIVEAAFLEVRNVLLDARLLGTHDSSSRWFVFQLLAREAVVNLIKTGRAESRRTYEDIEAAWLANRQGGKESIHVAGMFSKWVAEIHRPDPRGGAPGYLTAPEDGSFDVKVRLVRPNDDANPSATAGITVSIERDGNVIEVTPSRNQTLTPADPFFVDATSRNEERERAINDILSSMQQTLLVQPDSVLVQLRKNPGKLTIEESLSFWSVFAKVARRLSQAAGVVLGLLLMLYATSPVEARAEARRVVRELVVQWCPFCDEPGRTWRWTFEHPELYYSPASITLPTKRADFGEILPGEAKSDRPTGISLEVERLPDDPRLVRVRVVPPAEYRVNGTKFYINHGDDPPRRGDANHMITLGPAAVFEHRYTRPGKFALRVMVATRSTSAPAARPDLPPTEADGWSTVASAHAVVVIP
jgi:hypothetical protein